MIRAAIYAAATLAMWIFLTWAVELVRTCADMAHMGVFTMGAVMCGG